MRDRIVVTGATGSIGSALVTELVGHDIPVSLVQRKASTAISADAKIIQTPDLSTTPLDASELKDAELLVHLAALTSVKGSGQDVDGSQNVLIAKTVAQAAADAKVPNVLVLSSLAASIAEANSKQARHYGFQKARADEVFDEHLSADQNVIFVRPPAVYGPGLGGSMDTLAKLVRKGLPLPLGAAKTPRPYLALESLIEAFMALIAMTPDGWARLNRQKLELRDRELITTADLIRLIAEQTGQSTRLLPFPIWALRLLGKVTGKAELISGAVDPAQCETSPDWETIVGWSPTKKMPETLSFLKS